MSPTGYLIQPPDPEDNRGPVFVSRDEPAAAQARHHGWIVTPLYSTPALLDASENRRELIRDIVRTVLDEAVGSGNHGPGVQASCVQAAVELVNDADMER